MKFISNGVDWTDAMKTYTEQALHERLDRYSTYLNSCEVYVKKNNKSLKVAVDFDGYHVQTSGGDFYACIDEVAASLKRVIFKNVKRRDKRDMKIEEEVEADNLEDAYTIVKEKTLDLTPITREEAIDDFNKTDHTFYIYKDCMRMGNTCVLYRREDGTLGVIQVA